MQILSQCHKLIFSVFQHAALIFTSNTVVSRNIQCKNRFAGHSAVMPGLELTMAPKATAVEAQCLCLPTPEFVPIFSI